MKYTSITATEETSEMVGIVAKATRRSKAQTIAWLVEQEIKNNPFIYGEPIESDEGGDLLSQ